MFRTPPQPVRLPLSVGRITDPETQRKLENAQATALRKLVLEGKSVLYQPFCKPTRRFR
jgi:hypothetical protein